MTGRYHVFVRADIIALLRSLPKTQRQSVLRLINDLADDPFRQGDYVEFDEIGRPIQVLIVGRNAVWFWSDHVVKEVKVLAVKPAGR